METQSTITRYDVPTYKASPDVPWYHFLHGNVPGHQIDFIYRPEIPAGPVTPQHFSHLARFVKYIEPRRGSAFAFAIANLSRDDTQYEPGHGGIAILFGLRIEGAKDHAGRQDPPFCHAAAGVDRHFDAQTIYASAMAFLVTLSSTAGLGIEANTFYHQYLRCAPSSAAAKALLHRYVNEFYALPVPPASRLGLRWTADEKVVPKRVLIVHPVALAFERIAECAARIAAVLVESDIRWTCITTGREGDIGGGTTVRFVPDNEWNGEVADGPLMRLDDVPTDPAQLAAKLFGAQDVTRRATVRPGWRQLLALQSTQTNRATANAGPAWVHDRAGQAMAVPNAIEGSPASRRGVKKTGRLGVLIGGVAAFAVAALLLAVTAGMREIAPQQTERVLTAQKLPPLPPVVIALPAPSPAATPAKPARVKRKTTSVAKKQEPVQKAPTAESLFKRMRPTGR